MGCYRIQLNSKLERLLHGYRAKRRVERGGKVLQKSTAITELLATALDDIEPLREISIEEIVSRIEAIESMLCERKHIVDRAAFDYDCQLGRELLEQKPI